jgi:hypothetical protein
MVRKRARAAGIMAPIGNHSFRATGIMAYLAKGGTFEHAQSMAAYEAPTRPWTVSIGETPSSRLYFIW